MAPPTAVALIPARAGSRRIPDKNIRPLEGHPLIAYTIAAARASGVFEAVIVSTDDEDIAAVARHYGADVPFLRPPALAGDRSPDIEWVAFTVDTLLGTGVHFDAFSILRPTSPLRLPATIGRAWAAFRDDPGADSLRAVEPCAQHPGKMWIVHLSDETPRMRPLLDDDGAEPPWHSSPYQTLPPVYVQNASLELAWLRTLEKTGSIAGTAIRPFITQGHEGFDLNQPHDWVVLEHLLHTGQAVLPAVTEPPVGHP